VTVLTIREVARAAGVSRQTVSRVLNNKTQIAPETRQRVLNVMEQLGYRPNANARSLTGKGTQAIGLTLPDISNPFFTELATAIEAAAQERGYHVFLCNAGDTPDRELASIRLLQERRADGLILCSSRLPDDLLRQLLAQHHPIVLVNRRLEAPGSVQIRADYARGGYLATRHLLDRGHRDVAAITLLAETANSREKLNGYFQALEEAGIAPDPALIARGPSHVTGGYDAAMRLLQPPRRLSAIFVYSEAMAIGVLRACDVLGLRVPDDVAIVAFGGGRLSAMVHPPLSTIHVPLYSMGRRAFEMLAQLLAGQVPSPPQVLIKPTLVVRESSVRGASMADSQYQAAIQTEWPPE
jgi:LacI family transcriptional regulator